MNMKKFVKYVLIVGILSVTVSGIIDVRLQPTINRLDSISSVIEDGISNFQVKDIPEDYLMVQEEYMNQGEEYNNVLPQLLEKKNMSEANTISAIVLMQDFALYSTDLYNGTISPENLSNLKGLCNELLDFYNYMDINDIHDERLKVIYTDMEYALNEALPFIIMVAESPYSSNKEYIEISKKSIREIENFLTFSRQVIVEILNEELSLDSSTDL